MKFNVIHVGNNGNYSGHDSIDYQAILAIVATMTKKLISRYLMNNNILFRFLSNLILVYIYPISCSIAISF